MAGAPQDTIYALATPPGRSGVAVVRLSGPGAILASEKLTGRRLPARRASLALLRDPASGDLIDSAIVITYPGPSSFTGEDIVEFQCHGSRAVVSYLYKILENNDHFRIAEAGEFTRRALMNGRLDLTQVEGLADLLHAETEAQRRLAMRTLDGTLARKASAWREQLVHALALVEVTIDFADEELPADIVVALREKLTEISESLDRELVGAAAAERVRDGFEVALVGRPNAGKSTLLNALAGRDAALTSARPGTTRDVLEVRMDIDGLAATFLDMAGLRETGDDIESLGVARARERAERADVRVFLLEDPEDLDVLGVRRVVGDIVAFGKADLPRSVKVCDVSALSVSGLTGAGIDALVAAISDTLMDRTSTAGQVSNERQRTAIGRASEALAAASDAMLGGEGDIELVSMHIREALRALEFLVGNVDVESVLDVIFGAFCLGK